MCCAIHRLRHGWFIRQPAALCGIVGLKPTYGRVSRYGWLLSPVRWIKSGHSAGTSRMWPCSLNVISGHDPKDSTSVADEPPDYLAALEQPIAGLAGSASPRNLS